MRSAIYNPELLLAVIGSVVVATAFHEFGHASACRYGGARPGVMGVGCTSSGPRSTATSPTPTGSTARHGSGQTWAASTSTRSSRCSPAAVFFATGEEAALLVAVVQHVIMLQQLLPLLRFDGYYVLTDLTGVPDILSRIRPIFRSLCRGRKHEPQVAELKPWVRVVVTTYLVTLSRRFSSSSSGWSSRPRLLATVHDSFGLQIDRIVSADGSAEAAVGVLRMLALPCRCGDVAERRARANGGPRADPLVARERAAARRGRAVAAAVVGGVGYTGGRTATTSRSVRARRHDRRGRSRAARGAGRPPVVHAGPRVHVRPGRDHATGGS